MAAGLHPQLSAISRGVCCSDPQGGPARDPLAEQPIMLHEPSKWPAGAIGPARLAWLPMPADRLSAAAPGGGDGACLLWLHCSACDAGEAALLAAAAGETAAPKLRLPSPTPAPGRAACKGAEGSAVRVLGEGGGGPNGPYSLSEHIHFLLAGGQKAGTVLQLLVRRRP